MSVSQVDVRKIRGLVTKTLGPPETWTKWDGGWPGDIESALVDAIFSARAVYSTKNKKGVLALVETWRGERKRSTFSLTSLAAEIAHVGPIEWSKRFGNGQHSPGRPTTAPGGQTKAATVLEAARALSAIGVTSAEDITEATVANVKREMMRIPGVGFATSNYFLMLLGRPGVKPDTMVHRFLETACGHGFSNRNAEEAVTAVSDELQLPAHRLDHAIWSYESMRARR